MQKTPIFNFLIWIYKYLGWETYITQDKEICGCVLTFSCHAKQKKKNKFTKHGINKMTHMYAYISMLLKSVNKYVFYRDCY